MKVKKGEIFNSVKVAALPRNSFDLTNQHCTTADFADLVPICIHEAVPGDVFTINCETFIRFQPLITPMMHRCDFTVHYFFVPNRLLWDGFEDFITGNKALTTGLSTPALPYLLATDISSAGGDARHSVLNYMGCEVNFATKLDMAGFGTTFQLNALPLAAYQKIYYDYYVAKELLDFQTGGTDEFEKLVDGDNAAKVAKLTQMRQKGWGRDYFTAALPYAQKGQPVLIPMEGQVTVNPDVYNIPYGHSEWITTNNPSHIINGDVTVFANTTRIVEAGPVNNDSAIYDPNGTLIVENSVTTIEDLRRAMRLQEWLEKNARAGTRYTESLRAHFNVTSSDARLQRAEYITGVKSPIIVSEVLNTTGTEEVPQGNMAGHGIGIADGYSESYFAEEHGWIIGLLSVTPKASYSTGIPRFFSKRADFMDWYWVDFANIGEQEIERSELQASVMAPDTPTDTFGFIPRYAEYKFKNDLITGDFADGNADSDLGSLRTWVMQRRFGNVFGVDAELSTDFIYDDIKQVAGAPFAVDEMPIMIQHLNKIYASRQMPVYGTPSF